MHLSIELIHKCLAKNRKGQKELYLKLLPYLRAVALRYLWNNNLIEDVIQESFLFIFKNLDQFDLSKGAFVKWAVRITINTTLNYNKRVKFDNEEIDINLHDTTISESTLLEMTNIDIQTYFKQMPISYYEVFNLFVVEGYDHDEIAEILKINSALSRKRLSRARDWLKKRMEKSKNITIKGVDFSKYFLN